MPPGGVTARLWWCSRHGAGTHWKIPGASARGSAVAVPDDAAAAVAWNRPPPLAQLIPVFSCSFSVRCLLVACLLNHESVAKGAYRARTHIVSRRWCIMLLRVGCWVHLVWHSRMVSSGRWTRRHVFLVGWREFWLYFFLFKKRKQRLGDRQAARPFAECVEQLGWGGATSEHTRKSRLCTMAVTPVNSPSQSQVRVSSRVVAG